jgi:hypothetical protein
MANKTGIVTAVLGGAMVFGAEIPLGIRLRGGLQALAGIPLHIASEADAQLYWWGTVSNGTAAGWLDLVSPAILPFILCFLLPLAAMVLQLVAAPMGAPAGARLAKIAMIMWIVGTAFGLLDALVLGSALGQAVPLAQLGPGAVVAVLVSVLSGFALRGYKSD